MPTQLAASSAPTMDASATDGDNKLLTVPADRFLHLPHPALRELDTNQANCVRIWEAREGAKAIVHRRGFLLYQEAPLVILHLIFVEAAHRGQGIGSLLVNACPTPFFGNPVADGLWEKNGCDIRRPVRGLRFVTKGCGTPEHRQMVDREWTMALICCSLPATTRERVPHDPELLAELAAFVTACVESAHWHCGQHDTEPHLLVMAAHGVRAFTQFPEARKK